MISVNNISKSFNGIPAIKNISFEVKENETLVLLGTSGCGKTTTLRIINRLIEPDRGDVIINGKNVLSQQPDELRRGIGYVLQNHGLFPHYTIKENISVVPKLLNWDKDKIDHRTNELLEKFHLTDKSHKIYPGELSGGQQQRVGLARALAANSPILLMDEPFGALDPITKADIHKEFKELDELKQKTIILVTHDVHEAFELGDRICLMDKGEIMQIGTPFQLLFHPANDFVKSFFDKHRLQLEFKSIQLSNVLNFLSPSDSSNNNILSSSKTLWDAMDMIANSHGKVFVKDESSDETREINFASIERALNSFKQNQ
jgi:osmoprotectant transport system ATP-binding protein